MRRFLFCLVALAGIGTVGWFLVTDTVPTVYRTVTNPEAHPPLLWWMERTCVIILQIAVILLSAALVVRRPQEKHPDMPEPEKPPR